MPAAAVGDVLASAKTGWTGMPVTRMFSGGAPQAARLAFASSLAAKNSSQGSLNHMWWVSKSVVTVACGKRTFPAVRATR